MRASCSFAVIGCLALAGYGWSQTSADLRRRAKTTPEPITISIGESDVGGTRAAVSKNKEQTATEAVGDASGSTTGSTIRVPTGIMPPREPKPGSRAEKDKDSPSGEDTKMSQKFWKQQPPFTYVPLPDPTRVPEYTPKPLVGSDQLQDQSQQNRIEPQRIKLK